MEHIQRVKTKRRCGGFFLCFVTFISFFHKKEIKVNLQRTQPQRISIKIRRGSRNSSDFRAVYKAQCIKRNPKPNKELPLYSGEMGGEGFTRESE